MLADTLRGSLFAIGGREVRRGDGVILRRFVDRCGGSTARLVVLTTASPKMNTPPPATLPSSGRTSPLPPVIVQPSMEKSVLVRPVPPDAKMTALRP